MDTTPRLIRAQARQDGTLHRCWHCGGTIPYGSICRTWDHKGTEGLSRRYAHDGCSAARTVTGGPAEVA